MQAVRNLVIGLIALLLLLAPTAAAHKTVTSEDETIRFTWGFMNEPVVTWQKTALDLILRNHADASGIPGAHHNLTATLHYGDEEVELVLAPQRGLEEQGRYTSQPITLTREGIYVLHLKGTLNGQDVDIEIPSAHEIGGMHETFFPAAHDPYAPGGANSALQAEVDALKARIAALEAKADTQANTPAPVTPAGGSKTPAIGALGLIAALGAVAAVLALRRK